MTDQSVSPLGEISSIGTERQMAPKCLLVLERAPEGCDLPSRKVRKYVLLDQLSKARKIRRRTSYGINSICEVLICVLARRRELMPGQGKKNERGR
jgi:hypothetical protein